MRLLKHVVLITGDDTDVWNDTIMDEPPDWAQHVHVIDGFSDYDALIDLEIQKQQYKDQSAPDVFAADNTLVMEGTLPHVIHSIIRGQEFNLAENFNVVTAGTGLAVAYFTDF